MANYNESSRLLPQASDDFLKTACIDGIPRMGTSSTDRGYCFDFRTAVLFINAIFIGNAVLGIVYIGIYGIDECINPDGCFKQDHDYVFDRILQFCLGIGICFAGVGMYGAIRFKRWATITALIFYSFVWLGNVIGYNIFGIAMYFLVLYSHFAFTRLIKVRVVTE